MKKTKHTAFRLSYATKRKLIELSEVDKITMTECVNNLIVAEYRMRANDITEHRKRLKIEENNKDNEVI